jgi:hypothetical protein
MSPECVDRLHEAMQPENVIERPAVRVRLHEQDRLLNKSLTHDMSLTHDTSMHIAAW